MRANLLIPLLLLSFGVRAFSLTPEVEKAGEELIATLTADAKELADDDNPNEAQAIRQYIRQVRNALEQENSRQLDQWLDNFGNYQPSDEVTAQIATLKKALRESAERKVRETITGLENLLAGATDTLARAEQPEDLDKLLQSFSRSRFNDSESYDSNNREIRALLSQMNSARQFVSGWQDYLEASNSGNRSGALQSLQSLAGQENPLIPRSRIIARMKNEEADELDVTAIVEAVRKPDDMREAINKLNRLLQASRRSGPENTSLRETLKALGNLERPYREYLAGLPVSIEVFSESSESGENTLKSKLTPLRATLLLTVLPRTLDLPKSIVPAEGEGVDAFLARATEETARAGDSATALRIRTTRGLLTRSSSLATGELDALRSYAAGQQQLAASQYTLAVISLQESLKSGSSLIPAAKVGEMLESIRKDHPESYANGVAEFLTPTPAPRFDRSGRFEGMFPHDRGISGYPDDGRGGTTVVIPVPGQEKPAPAAPQDAPKPPEVRPAKE
jgi:hypothetical protein